MMLYLDRLDSLEKPAMMSKVFEAYMLQKINYKTVLYFTHFIDSVFILVWKDYHGVLKEKHDRHGWGRIAKDDALALERIGFYKEEQKAEKQLVGDRYETALKTLQRKLVLTDAGWEFIKIVFQLWTDDDERHSHHRYSLEVEQRQPAERRESGAYRGIRLAERSCFAGFCVADPSPPERKIAGSTTAAGTKKTEIRRQKAQGRNQNFLMVSL